ncbi:MAG: NAD(P)/FAD-dependent oxidoreductase [bacterium]
MRGKYDLIVIGTGTAGSHIAFKCRDAGMEVAIIDSRPFGGTCALRGCDPKKVLTGAAELVDWYNRMEGKGRPETGAGNADTRVAIHWPALMEFKETFTESVPREMEERFLQQGIDTYRGAAHFFNESTISVGSDKISARFIVIATGARPRKLNIPGEEYLTSSEEFMQLPTLPRDIVFIGGGCISFEFAHIAARADSRGIILHKNEQPLERFDPNLVNLLVRASKEAGIEIYTKTEVIGIERGGNHLLVKTNNKMFETILTQMAVHGAGRVPEIQSLDLERGGVEKERGGGVAVNGYLQSVSNPRVYAAGDCIRIGLPLTPAADMEGAVVAANIIGGNTTEVDYTGIPSVVFTVPPLARVGELEENRRKSKTHEVIFRDRSEWYSTRRTNLKYAASKVIIDRQADKIVGAHLLGPNAEEVINIFALVMRLDIPASKLKKAIYAYPSVCSDIEYMF